jgi:uncharacterized protein
MSLRSFRSLFVFASLIPAVAFAAAEPTDEGAKAYQKGDFFNAEKLLRPLADQGNPKAEYYMGFLYAQGNGVSQSMDKAIDWWKKAAAQNYAPAELNLGMVYESGQGGIEKNPQEAANWYRKAAALGDTQAETSLGDMYVTGRGVAKDPREAAKLYKAAVAKGYAPAFASFGYLYETGAGVPKDPVKAHMYYNVAAATSTGSVADKATSNRDRVAATLSKEDFAKARTLAHACMSSNYVKCE